MTQLYIIYVYIFPSQLPNAFKTNNRRSNRYFGRERSNLRRIRCFLSCFYLLRLRRYITGAQAPRVPETHKTTVSVRHIRVHPISSPRNAAPIRVLHLWRLAAEYQGPILQSCLSVRLMHTRRTQNAIVLQHYIEYSTLCFIDFPF